MGLCRWSPTCSHANGPWKGTGEPDPTGVCLPRCRGAAAPHPPAVPASDFLVPPCPQPSQATSARMVNEGGRRAEGLVPVTGVVPAELRGQEGTSRDGRMYRHWSETRVHTPAVQRLTPPPCAKARQRRSLHENAHVHPISEQLQTPADPRTHPSPSPRPWTGLVFHPGESRGLP